MQIVDVSLCLCQSSQIPSHDLRDFNGNQGEVQGSVFLGSNYGMLLLYLYFVIYVNSNEGCKNLSRLNFVRWRQILVVLEYGTGFMSPVWRLEF